MMYYIELALVTSIILIIFTLTVCVCRVLVALSKKAIDILCGTTKKKDNKNIEVSRTKTTKTEKKTEAKKDA